MTTDDYSKNFRQFFSEDLNEYKRWPTKTKTDRNRLFVKIHMEKLFVGDRKYQHIWEEIIENKKDLDEEIELNLKK